MSNNAARKEQACKSSFTPRLLEVELPSAIISATECVKSDNNAACHAQDRVPMFGFGLMGASAVATAITVGKGRSIPGDMSKSLRLTLKLLQNTFRGFVGTSDSQVSSTSYQ